MAEVMRDLRRHGVTIITIAIFAAKPPSPMVVQRYVSLDEFADETKAEALAMGFHRCRSAVRLSALFTPDFRRAGWKLSNPVIITYICSIKNPLLKRLLLNKILRERPARHVTLESFSA